MDALRSDPCRFQWQGCARGPFQGDATRVGVGGVIEDDDEDEDEGPNYFSERVLRAPAGFWRTTVLGPMDFTIKPEIMEPTERDWPLMMAVL